MNRKKAAAVFALIFSTSMMTTACSSTTDTPETTSDTVGTTAETVPINTETLASEQQDNRLLFEGFNEILDEHSSWNTTDEESYTALNNFNALFRKTALKPSGQGIIYFITALCVRHFANIFLIMIPNTRRT